MKRIKLTTTIILLLLVMGLCGTASGDPEIAGIGSEPKIGIVNDAAIHIARSPWPHERGDAQRTGRSQFPGPGASIRETMSVDLYSNKLTYRKLLNPYPGDSNIYKQMPLIRDDELVDTFRRLLVGPGNRISFMLRCWAEEERYGLYSYDMVEGQKWNRQSGFCMVTLDRSGNIYDAEESPPGPGLLYTQAVAIDADGQDIWFHKNYGSVSPELHNVGRRVYFSYSDNSDDFVRAFDLSGNLLWTSDPLPYNIFSISEDKDRNVFVYDVRCNLYKLDPDGEILWEIDHPPYDPMTSQTYHFIEKGPIISPDGKIWNLVSFVPDGLQSQVLPWVVLNSDGTFYKQGLHGVNKIPKTGCLGTDNRFYVYFEHGVLKCFEDWDQEVWSMTPPGNGKFLDMLMDSNDVIYLLHTAWGIQSLAEACYISVISPVNGEVLNTIKVDVPDNVCGVRAEIAIGEGKKLYFLSDAGYLKEYSSSPVLFNPSGKFKFTPKGEEEVPR